MRSARNRGPILSGCICAVVLIFVLGSGHSALTSGRDCTTVTDQELVNSILESMKDDSLIAPQMSHIVVGSVNRFVKLQGWTDTRRGYDRVNSIVSNTRCVTAINVNKFSETPPPADDPLRPAAGGGCASGMKQCGDVCIPDSDVCSMLTKSAI